MERLGTVAQDKGKKRTRHAPYSARISLFISLSGAYKPIRRVMRGVVRAPARNRRVRLASGGRGAGSAGAAQRSLAEGAPAAAWGVPAGLERRRGGGVR